MIYLDMDGVLADFVQHTIDLKIPNNNQWFEPKDTWTEETLAGERIKVVAMHTPGFWYGIPVMAGGQKLWDFCIEYAGAHNVSVLTCKPSKDSPDFIASEKLYWVNKKLGYLPPDLFHCVNHGEKKLYLKDGDVLVDDDRRHFEGAVEGAKFIHHTCVYEKTHDSIVMVKEPDVDATIAEIKRVFNAPN